MSTSASDLPPVATARQEFRLSWRIPLATLVGAAFGVNGFSYAAFGVLVTPLSRAFGESVAAISVWVTFLFLGNTLLSPLIGMLADRIGARRVVLVSLPLLAATWVVAGSIHLHLWMLYLAALAVGCIGTGASPLTYGRVINTWFDSGRGTALGIMSAGIGLSYLFGPRLVQSVVDAYGWRIGFFFIAAVQLIPWPLMLGWLRERRDTVARGSPSVETGLAVRAVVRMPVFWYTSIAFILYGLCAGGVTVNLVPFLTSSGLTRAHAAVTMSLLGVFSVVGRVVTGWIIDRRHVAWVCAALLLLEAAAFAVLGVFGVRFDLFAISLTGFAFGGDVSCMTYIIARYFGVRHFGAINGLLSVVVGVGVGLGPPGFSLLRQAAGTYSRPFLVSAAVAAVAAVFFLILRFYPFFQEPAAAGGPGASIPDA